MIINIRIISGNSRVLGVIRCLAILIGRDLHDLIYLEQVYFISISLQVNFISYYYLFYDWGFMIGFGINT